MSRPKRDLTGARFGELTVIARLPYLIKGHVGWHCQCSCGNLKNVDHSNLVLGRIQTCSDKSKHPPRQARKPNTRHRLNVEQVLEIREIWGARQMTQVALAKKYGVTKLTIYNIVHRKTWTDLEGRSC